MTVDEFLPRVAKSRRSGAGWSALCPAHEDRERSLSVRAGRSGGVLVHCFAGCAPADVARAVGLDERDLWAQRSPQERRKFELRRNAYRQRVDAVPKTVDVLVEAELAKIDADRLLEFGYVPPRRGIELNRARGRVSLFLGRPLDGVASLPWEIAPHETDPAWPALLMYRLAEVRRDYYAWLHPQEPYGPMVPLRQFHVDRAADRARADLRALR